jgi:predicted DNA-binding transcriptional regulator
MNSNDKSKKNRTKKPNSSFKMNLEAELQPLLQEIFKKVSIELKGVEREVKRSLKGIERDIQDIKELARKNRKILASMLDSPLIEEKRELEGIATGLELLEQVPSHLLRTYKVLMTKEYGATASEVARETEKSRPLESDYLNQLFERGLLIKKHDPVNRKKVKFFIKSSADYNVENHVSKEEKKVHKIWNNKPDIASETIANSSNLKTTSIMVNKKDDNDF